MNIIDTYLKSDELLGLIIKQGFLTIHLLDTQILFLVHLYQSFSTYSRSRRNLVKRSTFIHLVYHAKGLPERNHLQWTNVVGPRNTEKFLLKINKLLSFL